MGQCLHLWRMRIIPGTGSSLELSSSSSWCQDVVLFLDWRTPATALPGTGVEISHIIRCCLRCGDHGAMVGGGWRGGGTQSAALCLLSLPGAGTLSSVTTVMSAQAVAPMLFTWVQRGPKIVILSYLCVQSVLCISVVVGCNSRTPALSLDCH